MLQLEKTETKQNMNTMNNKINRKVDNSYTGAQKSNNHKISDEKWDFLVMKQRAKYASKMAKYHAFRKHITHQTLY